MRLVDPGDAKAFQTLDGRGRVIGHAPEDDKPVAGRGDTVAVDSKAVRQVQACDLALDQPLGGLRQRLLRLANADRRCARFGLAKLNQKLAEEMRFS